MERGGGGNQRAPWEEEGISEIQRRKDGKEEGGGYWTVSDREPWLTSQT